MLYYFDPNVTFFCECNKRTTYTYCANPTASNGFPLYNSYENHSSIRIVVEYIVVLAIINVAVVTVAVIIMYYYIIILIC